jgi:predicted transcriptional regulator
VGSTTVRISSDTAKVLREIARETGEPMQKVLDRAVEEHRRNLLLKEANLAYAALKKDPEKWRDELAEREAWDAALQDGLGDEN